MAKEDWGCHSWCSIPKAPGLILSPTYVGCGIIHLYSQNLTEAGGSEEVQGHLCLQCLVYARLWKKKNRQKSVEKAPYNLLWLTYILLLKKYS